MNSEISDSFGNYRLDFQTTFKMVLQLLFLDNSEMAWNKMTDFPGCYFLENRKQVIEISSQFSQLRKSVVPQGLALKLCDSILSEII